MVFKGVIHNVHILKTWRAPCLAPNFLRIDDCPWNKHFWQGQTKITSESNVAPWPSGADGKDWDVGEGLGRCSVNSLVVSQERTTRKNTKQNKLHKTSETK